jgi:L-rhamnose mutarotase
MKIKAGLFILAILVPLALAASAGILVLRRADAPPGKVQRYGMVIGVKPEKIAEYRKLHAAAWPGVLAKIKECHIRNYSIYLREVEPGQYLLFSYFEYTGGDFAADMARMAADPETQRWWKETDPCQTPIPTRLDKEFWSRMDEVFHAD